MMITNETFDKMACKDHTFSMYHSKHSKVID